jgi:hypothetical protein
MDMEWLKKHWSSAMTIGCIVIAGFIEAWQQASSGVPRNVPIPRLEGTWHYVPLTLLMVAGVVWLIGRKKPTIHPQPQATGIVPGIPALSALLGKNPSVEFNANQFFALAYYSPITAEIEKNIKIIAQQNSPNDREAFYARFIGIGYVAYQNDVSWFTIFGSQLRALEEMNSRGLIPVTDLKKHYDKAVIDYPKTFENYSFDQWLGFMKSRLLVAVYPSQMAELSWGGKDFLKYLAHMAWNTKEKPN